MNLNAVSYALKCIGSPRKFMPNITVGTFNDLPVPIPPLSNKFPIKVVILDKDNCFAKPHTTIVWPEYQAKMDALKKTYGENLLILSNTAGSSDDPTKQLAQDLEKSTGVRVLHHEVKKPGCYNEVVASLKSNGVIQDAKEIAVVGDRLMTDVVMANFMGAQSVWIREGVVPNPSIFCHMEKFMYKYMK